MDGVNNTSCPGSAWIEFEHNINCNISILIDGQPLQNVQDESGNRYGVFSNVTEAAGRHRVLIDSAHVPLPGDHPFEIIATELDGQPPGSTLTVRGTIQHEIEINHTYPIGHTIIEGVDLWDGHLTHSRQDVLVPGRRLSLDFSRSYSSQGNSSDGPVGAGWTHSYNIRVMQQCGAFTVHRRRRLRQRVPQPAGQRRAGGALLPVPGRADHTLRILPAADWLSLDAGARHRRAEHLWFFTKAAVRYHFISEPRLNTPGASGTTVYTLREIREPNGNAIVLDYLNGDTDPTTLDTVTESDAGIEKRGFRFEYQNVTGAPRIISLRGINKQHAGDLMGLEILYAL